MSQSKKTDSLNTGFGYKSDNQNYGRITDESVERLASRIGIERRRDYAAWELEDMRFTPSVIRRSAMSQGDYNPLYLDHEYAAGSAYGSMIVPPWLITGIEVTNAARDGMPGLHAWFRGTTIKWVRPIKENEYLTSVGVLTDVRRQKSRTSGEAVVQEYINTGYNDRGQEVGSMFTSWHRAERKTSKGIAKNQKSRGLAEYSEEDLERIAADYDKEVRRGDDPLYWEDVTIGEVLPMVVKGPTNQAQRRVGESGGIRMVRGAPGDWTHTHGNAFKLFERHPGLPFINEWGIPEVPVVIHNSNERCQTYLGLPGAYDAGYQRINWTVHMLTNWAGDRGFVSRLDIRFPSFNIMGDTTWCHGEVIGKRQEDGYNLVEIDIWNVNQLGVKVTDGRAEIRLPSRAKPDEIVWPTD